MFEKTKLARALMKHRVTLQFGRANVREMHAAIDGMSLLQISGGIEASILAIYETYIKFTNGGASADDALSAIEASRLSLGGGEWFRPQSLEAYVDYRVDIEHNGAPLPKGHVHYCLCVAESFFGPPPPTDRVAMALQNGHFLQNAINCAKAENLSAALVNAIWKFANGEIDENGFFDLVGPVMPDQWVEAAPKSMRSLERDLTDAEWKEYLDRPTITRSKSNRED